MIRSLFILSFLCIALTTYGSNDNKALLVQIDSFLEKGEPKKALKMVSKKIESEPENLVLLNKRAEIFVLMQKEREAYKELRNILSKDDKNCAALLTCAKLKVRVNQVDSALWYVEQGLAFEPTGKSFEGLYGLKGKILMTREEYNEAENCLVKAASSDDASLETLGNLADVMSENGKNDEAIIILEESITRFGMRMEPLINAGYVCNKMGRYDEAISYLDLALSIDGDNPYALANLANAYVRIGGLDIAYKQIEKSIQNDDTNAYAYKVKGDCLSEMSEPARACKEYKRAVEHGYAVLYNHDEIKKLIEANCGGR